MVCLEVVTATGFDVKGDFAWSSAKLFFGVSWVSHSWSETVAQVSEQSDPMKL